MKPVDGKKIRILLSAAAVFCVLSVQALAGNESANRLFREGLDEYLAGNYNSSISIFIRALREDSSHRGATAFILKARHQIEEQQKEAARAAREQERLLRSIKEERQREEALRRRELEEDTPEVRATRRASEHYLRGLEYAAEENLAKALREWDLSLLWEPENRQLEKRMEETRRELDMIARANLLERRIGQAYTFYQDGELSEAIDGWNEVLKIDPGNSIAADYIEEIEAQLTRREREARIARERERKQREIAALMEKGSGAMDAGSYIKAAGYFDQALKIDSANERAKTLKSRAEKENTDRLKSLIDEGKKLFDEGDYAQASLKFHGVLQIDRSNSKAGEYVEKLRKITSEQERREREVKARRMYYDAAALYMNGQYVECERLVTEILEIEPGNENAYRLLDRLERVRQLTVR